MTTLNDALRILDREFDVLFGEGIDAFDADVFSSCWALLGGHRDQELISVARKCRYKFRMAQQATGDGTTPVELVNFVRPLCDFAFRFLSKRQIVLVMDAASLAFESDVLPQLFVKTMGSCAAKSPDATKGRIEAAVIGVAGMHRYDAERIATLDSMDIPVTAG